MYPFQYLSRPKMLYLLYFFLIIFFTPFYFSPETSAAMLDFSDLGTPIPQTYGDIANLDLSYNVRSDFGNSVISTGSVVGHWRLGYSDLVDVAWGSLLNDPNLVAEINFAPTPGNFAILDNFDLGFWASDTYNTQVRVYNADYSNVTYDSGELAVANTASLTLRKACDNDSVTVLMLSFII